ncbi:hypothetical protein [Streptomyces sp. NPDC001508]|uniref:hypothetical protein n=1 Tax=Streptomyces sp. NPDC001508 TaxID=3154656 RepID=UPI00332DF7CA
MTGPATTAEWLACAVIGTGTAGAVLVLLKTVLDEGRLPDCWAARPTPRPCPPALPSYAPRRARRRHAGLPALDETQPLTRVQPQHARHSKGT